MPTYQYRCQDCGNETEKLQPHAEMLKDAGRLRCMKCEGRMRHVFGVPGIVTDTTFSAGRAASGLADDGLGDDDFKRRFAYAAARRAGVSPSGKSFCPGLCAPGKPYDPEAWVSHASARSDIKKRCRELNYAADGDVTVAQREPETDPNEGPYRVADKIVQKKVNEIVAKEHGGKVTKKKRADLVEATSERMSGNQ
jgi:putative FmdB family regulatory protein